MTTPKKRCEIDRVVHLLSKEKTRQEIIKELGIKPSALSNHLRRLEERGNIKRIGKVKIEVITTSHLHPRVTKNQVHKDFNKRGHAHNFKIQFNKKINLKEKPKIINDKKMKLLEELSFGSLKLVKKGFTIWINKNNLTVYSNNSYYSKNALHSKFYVLRDVDNLVQELINHYDLPSNYGIEIFREHYGLIFNKFAKWLISKHQKMYIEDKKGKTILWVDNSRKDDIGLKEFESEDPIRINSADNLFESHEKTGWKVTPEWTLEAINGIVKNQLIFDNNMKSHLEVLDKLGTAVDELRKEIRKFNHD